MACGTLLQSVGRRRFSPHPTVRDPEPLENTDIDPGTPPASLLLMPFKNGYTLGMKTAVSVPNEVFERADRLAKRLEVSRSELYSRALREFLARHSADEVTQALDQLCEELDTSSDEFVREASRRVLEATEW